MANVTRFPKKLVRATIRSRGYRVAICHVVETLNECLRTINWFSKLPMAVNPRLRNS